MPDSTARFRIATLECRDDGVEIAWEDGHVSGYPGIWLLEACRCARCGDTQTAVRHIRLIDKPPRPKPEACHHDATQLSIDWGDAHVSTYPLDWLRTMCLSAEARAQRKFKPDLWGSEMTMSLPRLNYAEVAASSDRWLEFLESILYRGFAILQQVPAAREHTEEIASLVGKLRLTNYAIYELESKPDPQIVADLAIALAPHTDEPYRIDPPGITFFHVIAQSDQGGESTLLDSFNLVSRLRQQDPEAYAVLTRVAARFHRSLVEGRLFEYQNPIIQADSDGDVTSVRLLDRGLAPVDCAPEEVQAFYDALRALLTLSYAGEGLIEFKLQPGEILVFNNQRVMHGRNGFESAASKRHIRSCHVDLDEFYSSLRILYREREDPRLYMTFRKD